ncbi:MAG: metal ABC transporter permease [Saprospiraceae bacterium]|nr:metal ABC transporter permease [Saprospiraceae bacterium]MBK9221219.1 metal ABC transporter permease [Saprospiraceae bacterium]MBK9721846.1 metal ABC transporter permease [Saprospiraceae bacterium]MBK9728907.1 metal ABC transporter permease [Saprospiraceae bacterium]
MNDTFNYLIEFFQSDLGIRCLVISMLVGTMCGLLGCFIVLRNMAMIGDALSHAILPGIVLAFIIAGYSTLGFFIGSVLAGLLSAFMITWLQQKVRVKNDAAIGIIFTFMFSLGIIGISWISGKQGVHLDLKDFLFGNLLSVSQEDLIMTATMAVLVVSVIIIFYRQLFITTFQPVLAGTMGIRAPRIHYLLMLLLSLVVVASLRSVGVILVVSMLITPASAALLLADRLSKVLIWASFLGSLSAILGLILSIAFDFPVGPSMAVMTTFIYAIIALTAPKRGFIPRWQARKNLQQRILIEDLLKRSYKSGKSLPYSLDQLAELTGNSKHSLSKWMQRLVKLNLFVKTNDTFLITETGIYRANQLIRAHRLWETFLVEELGLNEDQIHNDAEDIEHHLSEEDLHRLDEQLGYPEIDPHGSPIPKA